MKTENSNLIAAYRRRALHTTLGVALVVLSTTLPSRMLAQDAAGTPAKQADGAKKDAAQKDDKGKQGDGSTLKIVPAPRRDRSAGGTPQDGTPTPGQGAGQNPGGRGQFPGGGGQFPGGGGQFPGGGGNRFANRGTPFSFEFRGTDITNVLRFYAMMSGLTIVTDPGVTGPVTIINPKRVTLDEAFKILQSVLSVRGYTALQDGSVLKILSLESAKIETPLIRPDIDDGTLDPRNQVMTQVIPLESVDADIMARDLQPLISKSASLIGSVGTNALILTDRASNIKRIIDLVGALDKSSSRTEMKVYPLKHAEAPTVVDTINAIYRQISSRGRAGGAGGGQGQPGQPGGFQIQQPGQNPGQNPGGGGGARPAVVAVADTRTNSVIVVASPDNQEQIARDIINRLDDDEASAVSTETITIKYANAVEVSNTVNTVLSNMHGAATSSSGGTSFQQRAFGGFSGFGGFGGGDNSGTSVSSTDPFGKVVADARTNSIYATANPERMAKIKEIIKQLDVPVSIEPTTFVIPLKNAQAADVAAVLNQAFTSPGSNNNGGFSIFGFGGGNNQRQSSVQQRQPVNRRQSSSGSSGSALGFGRAAGRIRAVPPPPNAPDDGTNGGSAIPQGIPGVMTDQGFVPTDIGAAQEAGRNGDVTRQFGFGGFGGQRRGLGTSTSPQIGRGSNGGYVNLLQLQNNVFVTASPDGESLIVTTTPDNYEALKGIINALDIVPRQVMIEILVAEVTLDTDQKFGFNIAGTLRQILGSNSNLTGQISNPAAGFGTGSTALDPLSVGSQVLFSGTNYNAILQALDSNNKVKVLSTPRIFTSNNQQAVFDITTNVPFISGAISNGLVSTTTTNQVEYIQIGLQLTVTPRITRDGRVTIDVTQETSDLLGFDTLNSGTGAQTAPRYNDRYADTSVTILDGQTVAIGGLIRDQETTNISKVPLLGDVPLIGQFFRSREKQRNKVELMIFMTPHVIDTDELARDMTRKIAKPVVDQIPNISKEQPNLDLKKEPGAIQNSRRNGNRPIIINPNGDKSVPPTGDKALPPGGDKAVPPGP